MYMHMYTYISTVCSATVDCIVHVIVRVYMLYAHVHVHVHSQPSCCCLVPSKVTLLTELSVEVSAEFRTLLLLSTRRG